MFFTPILLLPKFQIINFKKEYKKMKRNNYRIENEIMTEQEFKNFVFGTGKVVSAKNPMLLASALERGDYVIGTRYNPFALQSVYHFKNNTFKVFNFVPGCHAEPLNIKLTCESDNMPLSEVVKMIYSFGCHDDLLINPTKDMLNLVGI